MDIRRGRGCCIARYNGGGSDGVYNRIMLKFRPIAPKPTICGGLTPENSEVPTKIGRGKRRYVKDNKNRSGSKRRKTPEKKVVTLPLLPETPERKESPRGWSSSESTEMVKNSPIWLSFGGGGGGGLVNSWVKVSSCVMDTCVDGLGCTDAERLMTLHTGKCPGFISDGLNRVRWVNGGYRELVGCREGENVTVSVCLKEEVLRLLTHTCAAAFTCQVQVVTCDKTGKSNIRVTTPCDVWRMDNGEFAWRLDTQAALSLGRY